MYKYLEEKSFQKIPIQNRISDFPVIKVWRTKVPSKLSFIVWLGLRIRALTQDRLYDIGYKIGSRCLYCHNNGESNHHIFYSFPFTKALWDFFFGGDGDLNDNADSLLERVHILRSPNLTRACFIYRR